MDGLSAGRPPNESATHYEVLSLTPSMINDVQVDSSNLLVKRAYHRALLQNHPDKTTAPSFAAAKSSSEAPRRSYTVDQISHAYNVLSSPLKRAEYDTRLKVARSTVDEEGEMAQFQTGVENIDLDDLNYDQKEERWFRSCRCGNMRGYVFCEHDLTEAAEDGVLLVGCQDCSLWLKIHFAVMGDE